MRSNSKRGKLWSTMVTARPWSRDCGDGDGGLEEISSRFGEKDRELGEMMKGIHECEYFSISSRLAIFRVLNGRIATIELRSDAIPPSGEGSLTGRTQEMSEDENRWPDGNSGTSQIRGVEHSLSVSYRGAHVQGWHKKSSVRKKKQNHHHFSIAFAPETRIVSETICTSIQHPIHQYRDLYWSKIDHI
jgi:hypothetical protein